MKDNFIDSFILFNSSSFKIYVEIKIKRFNHLNKLYIYKIDSQYRSLILYPCYDYSYNTNKKC